MLSRVLNTDQQEAITHLGSPLLIVAGPGSGKTLVIIERILHLVKNGLKPSEILCLTFSEKAAEEMKQRLERSIDITDMQISTFHSFAKELLQDNVLVSGIGMSAGVMSRASQLVWGLKNIDNFGLQYIEIGNNAVEVIESIVDGISTFKDELVDEQELSNYLSEKLKKDLDDEQRSFLLKLADMAKVYKKYQEFQRGKAIIDFDDMVVEAVKLLSKRDDIAKRYKNKFKHIFIDEFQDNNYAQLELVKLISNDGNVTAVGDDDQCIYRFQGAYLTNFKDFSRYFKNTTTVTLNQNYRSSQNIVKLANQLLQDIPERQPKKLFSANEVGDKILLASCSNENSQVEFVMKKISNLVGKSFTMRDGTKRALTYRDFIILSRKKTLGQKFANGLKAHGIPAVYVGNSNLFAMPIVKDFISYLMVAKDPERSGMEITRLMLLAGISEQNISEINRMAKKKSYTNPTDIDFVYDTLKNHDVLNVTQKHTLKEILSLIQKLTSFVNKASLSEVVYDVIMSISGIYKESLISNKPEDRRNRLILKEIHKISTEFELLNPHGSLAEFISHLMLMGKFDIDLEEGYEFEDAVTVTTIHQSKGKEFPAVFIADVATNKLPLKYQAKKFFVPSDLSKGVKVTDDEKQLYKEEERRLLYVAMTRAQRLLFISYAKKYGDNIRETKPSQFLNEINFENNPLIEFIDFAIDDAENQSYLIQQDRIENLKTDLQSKAIHSICQMNLKTAVEKIIDLSKIRYFEENGSLEGFDPGEIIEIDYAENTLESVLKSVNVPLINKETFKLSVSKIDTYKDCPLKFKFAHILEIPSPPKTYFDLGTSVHACVEHLTALEKDGVNVTEELALEILEKEWIVSSFKSEIEANEAKNKAVEMLRTYLKWRSANPNIPLAAEKKFSFDIGDVLFNGSIDRIEETPQGEYEVIDFKTGSVIETGNSIKDNFQMNVYALATEKLFGKLPRQTSLFYLKKDKIIVYEIESNQLDKVRKIIEDKVHSIMQEDFHPTPSVQICRRCDYQTICDSRKLE